MPARPPHQRLLLATYLTFGWVFAVVFLPVFNATRDLAVIVALGVFGVASLLVIVSLDSLAVDRHLPPMRDFPDLDIGEDCWVAGVLTGMAVFLVSLVVASFIPTPAPQPLTSVLPAVSLWAGSMAFLIKARPASELTRGDFAPVIPSPARTVGE